MTGGKSEGDCVRQASQAGLLVHVVNDSKLGGCVDDFSVTIAECVLDVVVFIQGKDLNVVMC